MSLTEGTYIWSIDDPKLLNNIINAKNNQLFSSDIFQIANLNWCIEINPNGMDEDSIDSFYVFLKLIKLPSSWQDITICRTIESPQSGSSYTMMSTYIDGKSSGWTAYSLRLKEIKELKLKELIFKIRIKMIQIRLKENDSLFFQSKIAYNKKEELIWKLDKKTLNILKLSNYGKSSSSNIYKNMWNITIYPNGDDHDDIGTFMVGLDLCSWPSNVSKMEIQWMISMKQLNYKQTFNSKYTLSNSGHIAETVSFEEFRGCNDFEISINLFILREYDDNNKEEKENDAAKDEDDEDAESMTVKRMSYKDTKNVSSAIVISLGISKYKYKSYVSLKVSSDFRNYRQTLNKKYGYRLITNIDSKHNDDYGSYLTANEAHQFLANAKEKLFAPSTNECVYDAVIVTVSGHGIQHELVCSDGSKLKYKDIRSIFNDHRLHEIPKLYWIDTCRVHDVDGDMMHNDDDIKTDDVAAKKKKKKKILSVTVMANSEGHSVAGGKVARFMCMAMDYCLKVDNNFTFGDIFDIAQSYIITQSDSTQSLVLNEMDKDALNVSFQAADKSRGYIEDDEDDQDGVYIASTVSALITRLGEEFKKYQLVLNRYSYLEYVDIMNVGDIGLESCVDEEDLDRMRIQILMDGLDEMGASNKDIKQFKAEMDKQYLEYKTLQKQVIKNEKNTLNVPSKLYKMIKSVIKQYQH